MGFITSWIQENVVEPVSSAVDEHVVQPMVQLIEPVVDTVITPAVDFVQENVVDPVVENVITPAADFVQDKVIEPIVTAGETVSEYASETADAFNESPIDGIVHLMPAYMIWKAAVDPDVSPTPLKDLFDEIGGSGPIEAVKSAFDWIRDHWPWLAAALAAVLLAVPLLKGILIKKIGGSILG